MQTSPGSTASSARKGAHLDHDRLAAERASQGEFSAIGDKKKPNKPQLAHAEAQLADPVAQADARIDSKTGNPEPQSTGTGPRTGPSRKLTKYEKRQDFIQ